MKPHDEWQNAEPGRRGRAWAVSLVLLAGCNGEAMLDSTAFAGLDPSAAIGSCDTPPPPPPEPTCTNVDPGPTYLRRLSITEYANSVQALVGTIPNLTRDFPLDSSKNGFDNNSELISMSTPVADAFRNAANLIASTVVGNTTLRQSLVTCDPTVATCLRSFIQRFGRLTYRRTLTTAEVDALVTLAGIANADANSYARVGLVLRALFQAPDFLFRVENSAPTTVPRALTGYELATRLSYDLWQSTPDEALLQAAEAGSLATVDGLRAAATRMLADPKAKTAFRKFHEGWLRLGLIDTARVDTTAFPLWTAGMRTSMREEVGRFTDDFAWRSGANYLDMLTASYSFLDANLAKLYGVAAPTTAWTKTTLPTAQRRSGLLTLGATLALTGRPEGTTPIIRGRFVRDVLLCEQLPSPPPNIPAISEPVPGETERQRLARHVSDPFCSSCHQLLEPVGFGMSQFDQIGQFRTADAFGNAIDTHGNLVNYTPSAFDGPSELGQILRQSARVPTCMSLELFRYLFGRTEMTKDACTMEVAQRELTASGGSFQSMLLAYVTSDSFRYRTSQADTLLSGGQP
jgi:hypothetical protein